VRKISAGKAGGFAGSPAVGAGSFDDPRWGAIVATLLRGRDLRPVQHAALFDARILDSRQHLVVCSPTNSGKSLVGYLVLLEALLRGRRAVLIEPLRALAQEQAEELNDVLGLLVPAVLAHAPRVRISTGDYRVDGEMPSDAPPGEGEVIVATPERLDAILRNPAHAAWASTIGAVVIDEAHLIADSRRGPTLELVVASMLSLPVPPRLVLLSATVGEPERLREWLRPCQLVTSSSRSPLTKEVWALEGDENADDVIRDELAAILRQPETASLVFVYRREATVALARKLSADLSVEVLAYHSGQPAAERLRVRERFRSGACRCVVATTALAMGVNLPATHVVVRDTTFFGFGKLRTDELLQILGRAGRGDRTGHGVVLVRPTDEWDAELLARELRDEVLPPLRSSFDSSLSRARRGWPESGSVVEASAAAIVAACLARVGEQGLSAAEISSLLGNTLGASSLVPRIDGALRWLSDPARVLAYRDENGRFQSTVLGRAGGRSMLPLPYVAGLGQLTRDLLSLDGSAKLLGRWTGLDHLFVMALASERTPKFRRFSEELASQVDGWLESRSRDEKSLLFSEWVTGSASASKADELLGSLGIAEQKPRAGSEHAARKRSYVAMLAAIVLDERSKGVPAGDIERRWGITGLDGSEEAWRDSALWLLAGHTSIFEVRAFYHHLREHCGVSPEKVKVVKHVLARIRGQAYDLLESLKYCSPLGPLLRGVRQVHVSQENVVGVATIRKLELAGFSSMSSVMALSVDQMVARGVQRRFAKQIRRYCQRRLR
jgi:helicase